ncbi:hypothetical protein RJ640_011635 [Escallonia rubra]|uniref:TIR domain-containing protein n=1 Tax=Escallonia rubra TaxID=112253 RepID=A0AA88R0I7_9ASTE|nr:hypothetical protein RJ640_011635 [Escallonia rubra]
MDVPSIAGIPAGVLPVGRSPPDTGGLLEISSELHKFIIETACRVIGKGILIQLISEDIDPSIEKSKGAIIVFSENYTDSSWCLHELELIMERWRTSWYPVLPIFYGTVDREHVKRQTHSYATGLLTLETALTPRRGTDPSTLRNISFQPAWLPENIPTQSQQPLPTKAPFGGSYRQSTVSSASTQHIKPLVHQKTDLLSRYSYKCPPGGEDKVVLYTSLGPIRSTSSNCREVIAILHEHRVTNFEHRDAWKDINFKKELQNLVLRLSYPRLFVKGRHIGGVDQIKDLDEKGLARRLDPFSPEADGVSPQGGTSGSNPSFVIGDPMKKVQWENSQGNLDLGASNSKDYPTLSVFSVWGKVTRAILRHGRRI